MPSPYGLYKEELESELLKLGQPAYRAKQIIDWLHLKKVISFDEMLNLPSELRASLAESLPMALKLRTVQDSGDAETFKYLWEMQDGGLVESVLICSRDRRTVCVSSQVGCPAKCAFCASGKQGFKRNLSAGEIVEQVVRIDHHLREQGEKVTNIVFMGMGEPLLNYDAVLKTIRILTHPDMGAMSQRRITVSTVGITDGIRALSDEGMKVNLVLSLHAPNQMVRKKIIPYARKYPLEDILEAMDGYAKKTKRDITYEYILIEGINDEPKHAEELARIARKRQCTVNLIPYNPVPGLNLQRPSGKRIRLFREVLDGKRIINTCRYQKGDDIAAACGQLALQEGAGACLSS